MLIKTLIIAVSFFVLETYASCDHPDDVLIREKCYQFNNVTVPYNEALMSCHSQGYTLISIHSDSELWEISGIAQSKLSWGSNMFYWLGLTNRSTGYQWDDLTPFNYSNWHYDSLNGSAYVYVNYHDQFWYCTDRNMLIKYICSYYPSLTTSLTTTLQARETTTTSSILPKNNCQQEDIILNEKCYSFNSIKLNYSNARYECSLLGKTLAIFDNINQITFLSSYAQTKFATTYTSFWIGLQRDNSTTPFYWQDGADVKFTNWSPGYPYSGQRFVGQDIASTKWKTFSEDQLLFSVCSGTV